MKRSKERTFPADTAVIQVARRFVHDHVVSAMSDLIGIEDVELAVSELASNAIEHGDGPDFRVRVSTGDDSVVVEVISAHEGTGLPHPARWGPPSPAATSGRGLHLVRTVSHEVWSQISEGSLLVGCRFKPAY